jgi:hypothetical protein
VADDDEEGVHGDKEEVEGDPGAATVLRDAGIPCQSRGRCYGDCFQ